MDNERCTAFSDPAGAIGHVCACACCVEDRIEERLGELAPVPRAEELMRLGDYPGAAGTLLDALYADVATVDDVPAPIEAECADFEALKGNVDRQAQAHEWGCEVVVERLGPDRVRLSERRIGGAQ